MEQQILVHRLPGGLVLLGEPMPWLRTVACTFMLPAGTCCEPEGKEGLAGAVMEMIERGCGDLDSRAYMEVLDALGVETGSAVMTTHSTFGAVMRSDVLPEALHLLGQALCDPTLPADQVEDVRQICMQELRGLEDEPSHRCFTELKRFRFSHPYGRIAQGTREGIESIQHVDIVDFHRRHFSPGGTVLAVAGNFEWKRLCDLVEELFGGWRGEAQSELSPVQVNYGSRHVDFASSQTHLALAYDCPAYGDAEYYPSRAVVGVLSDGMSSRLFTEVREKRGLVYSVLATCYSIRDRGSVLCYAGTTANRAEETLEVLLQTIDSIAQGVSPGELERLKFRIKSSMVFEQESSRARSRQIANDWCVLGRVPTQREVLAEIDRLTCESVREHFLRYRPRAFSLVSVGSEPLELPVGADHT
ncbi:MAG: insulinase family protein [Planctomycetota bacterium]|nr:MAG: insulinase family protein [Planctomycetota bacterium]